MLWFLHADTVPGPGALDAIRVRLRDERTTGGHFRLCFDGHGRSARQLTQIYPWLRVLGLYYGDSGILVRRSVYLECGSFQPYPLFEDVDLVRRIRRRDKFQGLSYSDQREHATAILWSHAAGAREWMQPQPQS